jgi:hypothetical protein
LTGQFVNNDLESVWNNNEHLSNDRKDLSLIAIEGSDEVPPQSEEQVDKFQVAILPYYFPIVYTLFALFIVIFLSR